MSANLPILYRNVMDGLPSDFARDAFLWAVERPGEDRMCYRAERFAREVDALVNALGPMVKMAHHDLADGQHKDLVNFILKRHANLRYDGNVAPRYAA